MTDKVRDMPQLNVRVRETMRDALNEMSDETGDSMSAIVRRAVANELAEYERRKRLDEMSDD